MPKFDIAAALADGYSYSEIASYLSELHGFDLNAAKYDGIGDEEVAGFLSAREVKPLEGGGKDIEGGFMSSAKSVVGQTAKGAGRVASDFFGADPGNAVSEWGQGVVDANPLAVREVPDILSRPGTAVTEAVGNAAPPMAGMVGARLVGQGITALSPLAGPAAPVVAGIGRGISWLGPAAIAALPSYSGIRDKQILKDEVYQDSAKAKAIAALGAGTVGFIEQKFGPQNWAMAALTKEGREELAEKLVGKTIEGSIGKGILRGGVEEGAEELVQNPVEQVASFDDPSTPESVKETLFGGAMGAIGGGVLGAGGGAISYATRPPEQAGPDPYEPSQMPDFEAARQQVESLPVPTPIIPQLKPADFAGISAVPDALSAMRAQPTVTAKVDTATQQVENATTPKGYGNPLDTAGEIITAVRGADEAKLAELEKAIEAPELDDFAAAIRGDIADRREELAERPEILPAGPQPDPQLIERTLAAISTADQPTLLQMADGLPGLVEGSPELAPYQWQLSEAITERQRTLWEESNVGRGKVSGDSGAPQRQPEQPAGIRDIEPIRGDSGRQGDGESGEGGSGTTEESPLLTAAHQHVAETGDMTMGGLAMALDVDIDTAEKLLEQVKATTPPPKGGSGKTVRLYRAESTSPAKQPAEWVAQSDNYKHNVDSSGRWFTDDREEAEWYRKNEYPDDGRIVAVDVPVEEAEQYRVSNMPPMVGGKNSKGNPRAFSRRPEKEFFLPRELADKKTVLEADATNNSQQAAPTSPSGDVALEADEYEEALFRKDTEGKTKAAVKATVLSMEREQSARAALLASPRAMREKARSTGMSVPEQSKITKANFDENGPRLERLKKHLESLPEDKKAAVKGWKELPPDDQNAAQVDAMGRGPKPTRAADEPARAFLARKREWEKGVSQTGGSETQAELPRTDETQAGTGVADIGPNTPDGYVTAKKQPGGKYKLFFTGTRNEVFSGELFDSAKQARDYFRVQREKLKQAHTTPETTSTAHPPSAEGVTAPSPGEASNAPAAQPSASKATQEKPAGVATSGQRLPAGTGARKQAEAGKARVEAAREAMRDLIRNPDIVGKDRADRIANAKSLVGFLQANAAKDLNTGYERGQQVAYTGEDAPEGMRSFIYLEGPKAGEYGVAATPEKRGEDAKREREAWQRQQDGFKRVRESGQEQAAKEPWQMTREEYARQVPENYNEDAWAEFFSDKVLLSLVERLADEVVDIAPSRERDNTRDEIVEKIRKRLLKLGWADEYAPYAEILALKYRGSITHANAVKAALNEGRLVPANVLAQYPYIVQMYPELADAKPRKDADLADVPETDFGNMESEQERKEREFNERIEAKQKEREEQESEEKRMGRRGKEMERHFNLRFDEDAGQTDKQMEAAVDAWIAGSGDAPSRIFGDSKGNPLTGKTILNSSPSKSFIARVKRMANEAKRPFAVVRRDDRNGVPVAGFIVELPTWYNERRTSGDPIILEQYFFDRATNTVLETVLPDEANRTGFVLPQDRAAQAEAASGERGDSFARENVRKNHYIKRRQPGLGDRKVPWELVSTVSAEGVMVDNKTFVVPFDQITDIRTGMPELGRGEVIFKDGMPVGGKVSAQTTSEKDEETASSEVGGEVVSPNEDNGYQKITKAEFEKRPDVLFHGTDREIVSFDTEQDMRFGVHFGTRETASSVPESTGKDRSKFRLIPAILDVKNPLRLPDLEFWQPKDIASELDKLGITYKKRAHLGAEYTTHKDLIAAIKKAGYDGVVYDNKFEGGGDSTIVFDDAQILTYERFVGTDGSQKTTIADFGEKIGGARKDVWAKSLDDMQKVDDADVSAQPLSKVWPAPDYQKMLDDGADKPTVALVRALRDSIPNKPKSGWKLNKWTDAVTAARIVAVGLLDGSIDPAKARHAIQVVNASKLGEGILDQAELYELVGHEKSLAGIRIAAAQYSLLNGVEYKPAKELWSVEQQAKATAFSNWPRQLSIGETRQEAIDKFVAKYNDMEINKPASKQVDFSIYSYRSGKTGFYVGKKIGRNYIDLAGPFDTAKEARKYKSENQEALIGKLAKAKEIPSERRDTNNPRVGEDMRGGQDVTPEMFREAFGFRGVEFGNWVEQKKRQSDLNEAYDALMDMAAILEISPKAISLNGELALAFGARGSGGKSAGGNTPAAHYEPGKVVINLTKKRGAGSLGHEWWHALDNYFARMRKAEGDMTEALDVSLVERGSAYEHKGEVRKEMVEAFGGVMRAIRSTAMKARASKLDNRRSAEYWTTKPEMSARAFESYLISKLHDQGASNDYLANIVDDQTWKAAESLGFELDDSYPYPTAGEMPKIRGAFDHFFQTVEQKETDKGVALFSSTALPPSARADIQGELTQAFGKLRARVLMRKITVLESQEEIKALAAMLSPDGMYSEDGAIIQAFAHNGHVYMAADGVETGHVVRTLKHEFAHIARLGLRGTKPWQALLRSVDERMDEDSATGEALREARKKVPADTNADLITEETLAYAIEDSPEVGLVRRAIAMIKRFLVNMGVSPNIFTVEDWSALAAATLRVQARVAMGEGVLQSVREMFKPVDTESAALSSDRDESFSLEFLPDSLMGNAEFISNLANTDTFKKHGLGGFDVPSKRIVAERMALVVKDGQILDSVVEFIPIDVVNILASEQLSPDVLLHDEAMLTDLFSGNSNQSVFFPVDVPTALVSSVALAIAKNKTGSGDLGRFSANRGTAVATGDKDLPVLGGKVTSVATENFFGVDDMAGAPFEGGPAGETLVDRHNSSPKEVYIKYNKRTKLSTIKNFSPTDPRIRYSKRFEADEADERNPLSWDAPLDSKKDTFLYNAQNKFIDLFRVQDAIQKHGGTIDEETDVRLAEELHHKRSAKRVDDFLINEVKPLMAELAEVAQDEKEFVRFLWARHAPEANKSLRLRNPNAEELREMRRVALERRNALAVKDEVKAFLAKEREMAAAKHDVETGEADDSLLVVLGQELDEMTANQTVQEYVKTRALHEGLKKVKPFDGDNTWLSGMKDDEAKAFMRGLSQEKKTAYSALAVKWDALIRRTREILVEYELEDQETIDSWANSFQYYAPLNREDMDGGKGIGQGFSVKGSSTKGRVGSHRAVSNILANIVLQRERAIVRGEKAAISRALHGLATANPNKDFWSIEIPPTERTVDPVTGMVINKADMGFKSRPNVVVNRFINDKGKIEERAVVFNDQNKRALRMAEALKNLDTADLGAILGVSAKITRFFSAMNTQYNVVFGPVNLVRDVQAAALNLSTTPLKGKSAAVLKRIVGIVPQLYKAVRAENKGQPLNTDVAKAWQEMQMEGGTTGFRDMFADSNERAERLRADILQVKRGKGKRALFALRQWVSDYNDMLENSTRLAVYMEARESGISKKRAAQLAKDVTLNFNRKGQVATQAGAMYAFFNAAAQGTEKMYRTMTGPAGKKILTGGLLLGAAQTMLLAAAGFDEDEPPEFIRERNLILPIGGKKYITVPMPLGFHVIPNLTRVPTEWALRGFKEPGKAVTEIAAIFAEAFNPLGNAGFSMQTFAPTPLDPFIALGENKDWTGRPIAKQDFNTLKPTPGHTRARDTASWPSEMVSRALNLLTGGNEYVPGMLSPTPDQIDYLVGQVAGGVGREAGKLLNVGRAAARGESSPAYRIPFVGRFYGNSGDISGVASRYYTNLKRVNRIALELDGIRENGGNVAKFIRSNPEARTIRYTEATYRNIQKLQRAKRRMLEGNASRSRVEAIDRRIIETMRRFNERANPNI